MRTALITGGSRGIGRAIALACARAGFAVALTGRSPASLEAAADEARRLGARALAIPFDVSDLAAIPPVVAEAAAGLGPVDVLVNNAGLAESASISATDAGLMERHLRVNAIAPFLLARQVLPGMVARGWGRVINVASVAGLSGAAYVAAYVASKHALVGVTRALAVELRGTGVTVNALCPGFVATDLAWGAARNIAAKTGRSFEEAVAFLARSNAGGRLIEPEEVADAAIRLLGDDRTSGETIVIDGLALESAGTA